MSILETMIEDMEIMKIENVVNGNFNADLFKQRLKEVSGRKYFKDIADDCNINASTLSKKCNGDGLSHADLLLIAAKYECSIDYLLGISEIKSSPKEIAPSPKEPLTYSSYARSISDFFNDRLYALDDKIIDAVALNNEIAQYIFSNIVSMRTLLANDTISQDVYNTWLDGLCNDFNYRVVSPASIVLEDSMGSEKPFPDFDAWKFIKNPIPSLSERELLKAYACELELYSDLPFKLKYDDLSYAIIKPTSKNQIAI